MISKDKGLRFNNGKTRHDLVPAFPQEQYAKVLTLGAEKYAERNWELGMRWSKILSSLERHLQAIKNGEDYDKETGLLHSAHVMCNAAFLTQYYKTYPQGDDRAHTYLNRSRIALDIDDVICDWVRPWCALHEMPNPTSWQFDRAISHKFDKMRGENLDNFYSSLPALISPDDIPFEPVCYITSRPVSSQVTEQWLDKHGFPAAPVITVGLGMSKVEALESMKVDVMVDDRYDNFVEINKAGIFCYLYDANHNQRYDVGFKRIYSLKELA